MSNIDAFYLSPSSCRSDGSVTGSVRKRGSMSLTSTPGFYSQHDGDDHHHNMEVTESNEQSKRARFNEPLSPGIVSLPTADSAEEMEMTIESDEVAAKPAAASTKVEWWKQQRLKPRNAPPAQSMNASQECIVCRLPCHPSSSTNIATSSGMDIAPSPSASHHHQTTLLQYFTPKFAGKSLTDEHGFVVERKMSKMVLALPPVESPKHPSSNSSKMALCTFCEKAVCANCQATCEDCQQIFCSFCSTRDYNSSVDRVVCLDCRDRSKESTQHMLID